MFVGKCVMDGNCLLATTHSMRANSTINTGTHNELDQGTEEKYMFHSTFIIFSRNSAGIGNWHRFSNQNELFSFGLLVGCQRVTESVSRLFCINNVFYALE